MSLLIFLHIYCLIVHFLVIFYLVDALKNKTAPAFIKGTGVLIIAAILGVLTNISSLYTIYDYGKDSIRGKSELTIGDSKDSGGLDKNYALDFIFFNPFTNSIV